MTEQSVGVRELKTHLSAYLREVKSGKTIAITERGKVVGRLVPVAPSLQERIETMRRAGLVRWNGKKLAPIKPMATLRGERTIAELIGEDRE